MYFSSTSLLEQSFRRKSLLKSLNCLGAEKATRMTARAVIRRPGGDVMITPPGLMSSEPAAADT